MIQIRTKDADQAAFYWTQQDVSFLRAQCKNGYSKKVLWFIFESSMNEEQFQILKNNYRNGKTLVQPKDYAAKRAEIKNLIRQNIFLQ